MTGIFTQNDYKKCLNYLIQSRSGGKRGELKKIAEAAQMNASTLSQAIQGTRNLTPEQSVAIGNYFGLSESEVVYFSLLVQLDRAGTPALRKVLESQIEALRNSETQLSTRLPFEKRLPEEQQSIFYSNWYYSAVRNLVAVPNHQTIDSICDRLRLSRQLVSLVLQFLTETGLLVEGQDGKLQPGPKTTHLEASSPLTARHHGNWRVKAMERHPTIDGKRELAYTSPMSLSRKDAIKIREQLISAIEEACKLVDQSSSETTYCLNLDWFEF